MKGGDKWGMPGRAPQAGGSYRRNATLSSSKKPPSAEPDPRLLMALCLYYFVQPPSCPSVLIHHPSIIQSSTHLPLYPSMYPPMTQPASQRPIYPSVLPLIHPPICPFIYPSIHPSSVHPSVIHPSVHHPSVHPPSPTHPSTYPAPIQSSTPPSFIAHPQCARSSARWVGGNDNMVPVLPVVAITVRWGTDASRKDGLYSILALVDHVQSKCAPQSTRCRRVTCRKEASKLSPEGRRRR